MHRLGPIVALTVLACGPTTPPQGVTSDGATGGSPATDSSTSGLSGGPAPTTSTSTTEADPSTTAVATSLPHDLGAATPDLGPSRTCDAFLQDCPEGEKCVPWFPDGITPALRCVPVTGNAQVNEPCTAMKGGDGIDDCALGAICRYVDQDGHGFCVGQCTGSIDDAICPPGLSCLISAREAITICLPECHPLLGDCIGNLDCFAVGEGFECMADASGEAGQANDSCEAPNACDEGLVCLDSVSASSACDPKVQGCCQPFCQFPDGPCPNMDQQCLPWFDPMHVLPNYKDLGVCAIQE